MPQRLRYAGYWYDAELGWYWVGVRYYDPALGRWVQPDPSQQDGVRTYVYVGDDPVDASDPTGLSGSDDGCNVPIFGYWCERNMRARAVRAELSLLGGGLILAGIGKGGKYILYGYADHGSAICILASVSTVPLALRSIVPILERNEGRLLIINRHVPSEGTQGSGGISLETAAAAAQRNGIDMRMIELRYEAADRPGLKGATGFYPLDQWWSKVTPERGSTGKFVVTLTDEGLQSEMTAVGTIAHELNHIRGVLRTDVATEEIDAELAGMFAEEYYR